MNVIAEQNLLIGNLARSFRLAWQTSRTLTIAHAVLVVVQGLLPLVGLYLIKLVVDTVAEGIGGAEKERIVSMYSTRGKS